MWKMWNSEGLHSQEKGEAEVEQVPDDLAI